MPFPLRTAAGLCLWLLTAAPPSRAAVFCADTPAAIADAMNTAKANGEDDDIRIVSGLYLLDQTLRLGNVETESFALAFSGRWNAGCTAQSAGSASTLSGRGERQIFVLDLADGTDLTVSDLAFVAGSAAFNVSGGAVSLSGARSVRIERSQFYSNEMQNNDAPVTVEVGGADSSLTFRNNLVFGNTARGTTGVFLTALQGTAYVTGNTITANESSTPCPCSGLNYSGTSAYTLSNNIVWGNEGGDVFINAVDPLHLHNDIGTIVAGGNAPGSGSTGNLSVDPGFAADGAHLAPDSPLVNAGLAAAPGGIGDLDGGRGPRLVGAGVDLGALESDVIFRDGFECPECAISAAAR